MAILNRTIESELVVEKASADSITGKDILFWIFCGLMAALASSPIWFPLIVVIRHSQEH